MLLTRLKCILPISTKTVFNCNNSRKTSTVNEHIPHSPTPFLSVLDQSGRLTQQPKSPHNQILVIRISTLKCSAALWLTEIIWYRGITCVCHILLMFTIMMVMLYMLIITINIWVDFVFVYQ